jgi:hypothetical protein
MPSKLTPIILAVVLGTFCGISDAKARPPQSRNEQGLIESVDPTARVLQLRRPHRSEPLRLVWNARTRFVAGQHFTNADQLRSGRAAQVWYRTPLFGERFATKIVLRDSTPATRPANCGRGCL